MIGQVRIIRFGSMLRSDMPLSLFTVGYNEQKHMVRPEGFPVVQFLMSRAGMGTFSFYEAGNFNLGPDEFIVVPPAVAHEYYPLPDHTPWELGYISITGKNVDALLNHFEFDYLKVMKLRQSEEVWESLDKLWQLADAGMGDMEWTASEMLYGFLLLLHRQSHYPLDPAPGKSDATRAASAVKQAAAIIREHYSEPLLLSHLAQSLGYTHQHLNLLFHKKYRTSIYRYLQRVRFEASLTLLRDPSIPVHEVARRVGLEVGSFIRMFRQNWGGMTPGAWRKKDE